MSKLTTQLDIYITENTFQYAQHISKLSYQLYKFNLLLEHV